MQEKLTKKEIRLFKKLNSPVKIQDFLNKIPINFEENKIDTCMSPRKVLEKNKCHCIEGAMLAAAILKFHNQKPLILDMEGEKNDWDHIITIFKKDNKWGAISKTNHSVLRYREPVYQNIRELVMSYFHEYTDDKGNGNKTLRAFSNPVNLNRFNRINWITSSKNLFEIPEYLAEIKHQKILTNKQIKQLRKADKIERIAGQLIEWKPNKRLKLDFIKQ